MKHQQPLITRDKSSLCFAIIAYCLLFMTPVFSAESSTVSRLFEEGVNALLDKKPEKAIEKYRKILVLEPDNAEAYFRIGQAFIQLRDVNSAVSNVIRATQLAPHNARYSLNLGSIYEKVEKTDRALVEYQRLVDSGTSDKRVKEAEKRLALASGRELARKGELNAAVLIFNGLLLDYPNDARVLFNIGTFYYVMGRADDAERVFLRLLEVAPDNSEVHQRLANIYERTGKLDKAIEHLQKNVELGENSSGVRDSQIRIGILIGRQHLAVRRWQDAILAFKEVIALNPRKIEAYFNIGIANLNLKKLRLAENSFRTVLQIDENHFGTRMNLAALLYDTNRVKASETELQYIIDNDSKGTFKKQASARLNLLYTQIADKALREGKIEESLREYQKALDYYSGNVKASFNSGLILLQQRKFKEAVVEFEKVIKISPENIRARLNLAALYADMQNYSKAADQYEIIMQLDIDSKEGKIAKTKWKIAKARGLWSERNLSAAETLFEEIVAEEPDNYEAHTYLGIIQSSKSQYSKAAQSYQRVLDLRPDHRRMRLSLGQSYEQLGMDLLAAQEYRTIIFNGAEPFVVNQAKERLKLVESRLSGFSNMLSYQMNYDDNVSFNDANPTTELRSSSSVSVVYGYSLKDNLSFRVVWSPTYSALHKSQQDFLSSVLQGHVTSGSPDKNWTLNFGQQSQQSVVQERTLSQSNDASVSKTQKLFLPAVFGLTPVGFDSADIPTRLVLSVNARYIVSTVGGETLTASSGGVRSSMSQSLAWGVNAAVSYNLTLRRSNTIENFINNPGASATDPVTGLSVSLPRLLVYDSEDYEYNQHTFSLTLSKVLAAGLSGTLTSNISYTGYVNADSGSVAEGNSTKRNNLSLGLTGSVNYFFFKDISMFASASRTMNFSSLATGLRSGLTAGEAIGSFQSSSLGSYNRFTVIAGIRMNF